MRFRSLRLAVVGVALAMSAVGGAATWAQQQRATGGRGKAADRAPASVAQPLLETNAAVRTALETPRKTPRDYVQAVLWLIDLGRPELAKPIMADLAKLPLMDAQRVALVGEFGSHGMLHIARASKDLGAEAVTFSDACMVAARAAANDPQKIAALVKQLSDPSPEARLVARNDLAATGQVGATAALEAVARETDSERRAALLQAIEGMHPLVDAPLLAMLATDDPRLRSDVAALLQRLAVPQAAPLLVTDPATAEKAVATAIHNYKRGTYPFAVDADNQVEFWKWDDATKTLGVARLPADEAQVAWISRLADELARIRPDLPGVQLHALVLRLESTGLLGAASNAGGVKSAALAQADPRELNAALVIALRENYSHAALALVEALGKASDTGILFTADGKPSPLAAAVDSPDRRVRFAALRAIMGLNPATPYPGASHVPDALAWFAGSAGERQAVVAMPTIAAASDLAGKLAPLNLVSAAANNGREAVDLARAMPDLELALIDMNILLPEIRQAVYELRISPPTADVPIALLAADGRLDAAKRLAAEHTRVIAVSRPHTPEALATIVSDLAKLSARDAVAAEQRVAQAEEARKWLAELSSGGRPFYTFRSAPAARGGQAHIAPQTPQNEPVPSDLPNAPPAPAPEALPPQ